MTKIDDILDTPAPRATNPAYTWLRRIGIAFEILFWLIAGLAVLFKLESWEGSSELAVVSFSALAFFYLSFTFLVTGAWSNRQVAGALGAGFALALLLLGNLFILESWAGGREMLLVGLPACAIAALTTFYFLIQASRAQQPTAFYWHLLARLALVFLVW